MISQKKLLTALSARKKETDKAAQSKYLLANKVFQFKVFLTSNKRDSILLTEGVLSAGFDLKGFPFPLKIC